ncbi:ADOP family duplicated permease [Acidicapsa dinghuensis]|uniref:ADOP family duplicated permease n=1 Tax=Acidicapsa dinghuensis TaxID=2218256 RepID=A0ABW1EID2_9BACT|nr:ABC transporter permease [Acidicapsa dinghuensis]
MYGLRARLRALFHGKSELDEELQFHLEQAVQAMREAGMDEAEARRKAMIEFGGVERTREETYRQWPGWILDNCMQDLRYALRGFRRSPVFAVTAIATLTLGIGATTAVLSVIDPILFRSLPYAHADQLVSVGLTAPIIPDEFMLGGSYYVWRDNQRPFTSFTSETGVDECDLTEHNPARLNCAHVEGNFLSVLGIVPSLGRNFLPEEDKPNGPKVALISYRLWRSRYASNPAVIDKLIDIDGTATRIVGVLPQGFEMPALEPADILLPQVLNEAEQRKADPGRVMYAYARLKPGITMEQAAQSLQPLFQYSLKLVPPAFQKEVHLRVRSVRDRQMQHVRLTAWILFGAVLAVFMIACANVAGLMLARAAARERELAVRSALGASRGQLVQQTMIEAALLSLIAAIAGWALAAILLHLFVAISPAAMPFLDKAHLDIRIAAATLILTACCAIGLGVLASLHRPRALSLMMRGSPFGAQALLRRMMMVAQIAISMVLLTASALLVRSFWNLQNQNLGLTPTGVVTASIELGQQGYNTGQKQMQFFLQAETALRRLPGVTAVGMSDTLPPAGGHHESILHVMAVQGKPSAGISEGTGGMVAWRWVTPDYFKVLSIPFVAGRNFTEAERTGTEHEMIVSQLLADLLFPGSDSVQKALGQQVRPSPNEPWYTIVGVVGNVRNSGLANADEPEYYRLSRSAPDDWRRSGVLILATSTPPHALVPWVRSEIARIDPVTPVEIEALSERVGKLADRPRFEAALLSFFALAGLGMALIGLYGLVAYIAERRTSEIGVRMALGADRGDVLRLIAWEGMRLVVLGGALGLAASLASAILLRHLLFQVGPYDPAVFIGVSVLLCLVAFAAILAPARKAMRVEPVVALRCE